MTGRLNTHMRSLMMPLESYYDHEGETMNKIDKIEEIRKYLRDHSALSKMLMI